MVFECENGSRIVIFILSSDGMLSVISNAITLCRFHGNEHEYNDYCYNIIFFKSNYHTVPIFDTLSNIFTPLFRTVPPAQ